MVAPKTLLASLAAAALALTLASCAPASSTDGEAPESGNGVTLAEVKDAGVLVVGTEGTYAPFTFHEGGTGDLTGYDVEVITAVADELGVDVKFEETQWDAIFAGLESGRFDVIANQVSINPDREKTFEFSTPYTYSPGVLVVPEGSDIASLDDLDGRTTAQSLTSNWADVAKSYGATVEGVEGWAQSVELLRQGRVDATVNDALTFYDYEKTEGGDTGLEIVDTTDEVSENAFTFRKGSETLVDAVNEALATLSADGTLAAISDKYFGADVTVAP
ncbi:MAG: amino acid ABC transporter substrate-binding protein [Rhodoglobus sp.]